MQRVIYIVLIVALLFGWIKVSANESDDSITIHDAAISKLPDTPIKAGEK